MILLVALLSLSGLALTANADTLYVAGNSTYTISTVNEIPDGDDVVVESGSRLRLNGFSETVNSISGNGNISLGSGHLTVGGSSNTSFGGSIQGTGGLTLGGNGILTLGQINTYNGATIINGGTLRLGASNIISDNSAVTFSGGSFDTNGFNERVGSLTLTADSSINFSASNPGALRFADSSGNAWTNGTTLTVNGWAGSTTGQLGDQLIFMGATGLTNDQLAQIKFFNPAGLAAGTYDATILAGGEVVPVPEPATMTLGALLLGLVGARNRRNKKDVVKA